MPGPIAFVVLVLLIVGGSYAWRELSRRKVSRGLEASARDLGFAPLEPADARWPRDLPFMIFTRAETRDGTVSRTKHKLSNVLAGTRGNVEVLVFNLRFYEERGQDYAIRDLGCAVTSLPGPAAPYVGENEMVEVIGDRLLVSEPKVASDTLVASIDACLRTRQRVIDGLPPEA